MSRRTIRLIGGIVGLACGPLGCAEDNPQAVTGCPTASGGNVPGQSSQRITFPATIDGSEYTLEAMIYQPEDGRALHPFILLSHGRHGPNPARNLVEVCGMAPLGQALAARGYIVMMLVRRGYGNSQGPDSEYLETAESSGLAGAKDVASGVEYMRMQPGVDASRMALIGHSQGGWVTLAASTLPIAGVLGAVNLSGGINFRQEHDATTIRASPVNELHMYQSAQIYGAAASVPSSWIYAENDNFRTDSVRAWLSGFQQAGGTATLAITPAYGTGTDGHSSTAQPAVIMDNLTSFFGAIGLGLDGQD